MHSLYRKVHGPRVDKSQRIAEMLSGRAEGWVIFEGRVASCSRVHGARRRDTYPGVGLARVSTPWPATKQCCLRGTMQPDMPRSRLTSNIKPARLRGRQEFQASGHGRANATRETDAGIRAMQIKGKFSDAIAGPASMYPLLSWRRRMRGDATRNR